MSPGDQRIAIVGMAAIMPGAGDMATYWRNVVNGVDAITDVPEHRWDSDFYDPARAKRPDRLYARRGGFVDEHATFEPLRFGIMPNAVVDIEPDQLMALNVTAAAIADAGGAERLPDADRIGVIVGRVGTLSSGQARYAQRVRTPEQVVVALRELLPGVTEDQLTAVRERYDTVFGPHHPEGSIGTTPNLTASRIANRFNLRGPAFTLDAACASSLIAVDQGMTALLSGRLDAVLAGGVHHSHDVSFWSVFSQLQALSKKGQIRPFDRVADGLLIGEGTGMVVLKRLADAERDGDRVYAVLRGSGVSSDGRSASMFNPAASGQVLAIRRAWQMAGLDPAAPGAIGLLEAHGTATPTGDAAELTTVGEVFGPHSGGDRAVIGSVKSMIGHTMSAAGMAGLIKTALAIHRRVLPPTLHCDDPRAEMEPTRFAPLSSARPWESSEPLRAGVNAFGFGGINAHLVLEEHTAARTGIAVRQPEKILWLSGPDPEALTRSLDRDDAAVRATEPQPDGTSRLGIVDPTGERLAAARRIVARGEGWRGGRDVWFSPRPLIGAGGGKIAFVYPGFEGEFQPRTADIAAHFGLPDQDWAAEDLGGQGRHQIEVGRFLTEALARIGVRPDAVAGHSTGEWTAATVAGQLSAETVDRVAGLFAADTGEFPDYAFLAVSAPAGDITPMLADHPGVVLTHDNAPTQCVVNGPAEAVQRFAAELRGRKILCQVMPFRSASHTPVFGDRLRPVIDEVGSFDVRKPRIPIWSATLAAPFPQDPAAATDLIIRHMLEPVWFRQTVLAMYDAGYRAFVQVGPGQLAALVQDNLRDREHLAVAANSARRDGLAQLRRVATALWAVGGSPDMSALDRRRSTVTVPPPAKGPAVKLDLSGALVRLGPGAADLLRTPAPPRPDAAPAPAPIKMARRSEASPVVAAAKAADQRAEVAAAHESSLAVLRKSGRSGVAAELAALLAESASPPAKVKPAQDGILHRETLHVSVGDMPYLSDHCFVRQPADWPVMADRRPVVPAATLVTHMMAAAERAVPGRRAVGVLDARFHRWLIAEPARDVGIVVRDAGPDRVSVALGGFARAVIELAGKHPERPDVWRPDPATERPPTTSAADMYEQRLLFHGPRFQGMTSIDALGDRHIRGTLTVPSPPGALLDSGLQIIANWLVTTQPERTLALPVTFGRLRFFGEPPAAGTTCQAVARIDDIDDAEARTSVQIAQDGVVWMEFGETIVRRFDTHPTARRAETFPERFGLSVRQPEGWVLAFDSWTDPVSRTMASFTILGSAGADEFDRIPTVRQPSWLLGRIAAKDAVRHRQWDAGIAEVYPIELTVSNDPGGRPRVTPRTGAGLIDCDVSLAHCREAAVALALPREPGADPAAPGVGIDIAEITAHPESTIRYALGDGERALLEQLADGDHDAWFARFWAAKEAVGKAEHTGLDGRPRAFAVRAADATGLTVTVSGRTYRVGLRDVANAAGLPARRYAVAWTWGPSTKP